MHNIELNKTCIYGKISEDFLITERLFKIEKSKKIVGSQSTNQLNKNTWQIKTGIEQSRTYNCCSVKLTGDFASFGFV